MDNQTHWARIYANRQKRLAFLQHEHYYVN